jgi:SAM-dependent methyltransferase
VDSSSSGAGDYLLGSRDEELVRLAFQHRIWAEQAFSLWSRSGFGYGKTILDLGCGPGFTSVDLAHLVGPEGRVLGVDASRKFLDHLERQVEEQGLGNVETIQCDVQQFEPEEATLDGAYARWLFCFLQDPEAVVTNVARALRPGAALAVTDYFNYRAFTFGPRSAVLDHVVEAVQRCWTMRGGDLDVQGRVPAMMQARGLEVVEISTSSRIARPGSPPWYWPRTFFSNFMPTLIEAGLVSAEQQEAFEREWAVRGADPSSYLYLPPMIDIIGVKR